MKPYLIVYIFCLAMSFISCSANNDCGNRISNEINNSINSDRIVIFERDCGATTKTSTQVSVLKVSEKLNNESGNIFISDFIPLNALWKNDSMIVIKTSQVNTKVFKEESSLGGIQILYEID